MSFPTPKTDNSVWAKVAVFIAASYVLGFSGMPIGMRTLLWIVMFVALFKK